jgi:hypothetical protein
VATVDAVIVVALLLMPIRSAGAEFGPLGTEFQVNSYTMHQQYSPTVAVSADGAFVVAWRIGYGGGYDDVVAQRYSSTGQPLGAEFLVTTQGFSGPDVIAEADGAFVVAWEGPDGNNQGVFARRFDSSGQPIGTEFQVNSSAAGFQYHIAMAMTGGGTFVVTWSSFGSGSGGTGVFGRRYDGAGQPVGSEFRINSYTGRQARPAVASGSDGAFVVAWSSEAQDDGIFGGVFAQRFASSGARLGSEFQVNSYTHGGQGRPTVAAAAEGSFLVAWGSQDQDGDSPGVFGQCYDSNGLAVGGEFQVNSYTSGFQGRVTAAAGADGTFMVAWDSNGQDGHSYAVFARRYDSSGHGLGAEFQVSSFTISTQEWPAVAAGADGTFVATWVSWFQDGDLGGVFGQRFGSVAPNDHCEAAALVSSLPFSDTLDANLASTDPSDPVRCDSSQGLSNVWYSYTPLADTLLLIDASQSLDYVPSISVYTGACGALVEAACTGTDRPVLLFTAQGGTTYRIEVAGGGATLPILDLSIEALDCPSAPDASCGSVEKALLLVKEDSPGKEKLIAKLLGGPALSQTDFGNPLVAGGTAYTLCLYDDADSLAGGLPVDRAGAICVDRACWSSLGGDPPSGSGYKYVDKLREAFGIFKLLLKGGSAGSSKALLKGKGSSLPRGIPAGLQSSASVTMQLHGNDAPQCLSAILSDMKRQEPEFFKAKFAP